METKAFTLTVTEQEIQIISAGLSELPFKAVAALIQKLQEQINAQVNTTVIDTTAAD